jgi:hypothetical protein
MSVQEVFSAEEKQQLTNERRTNEYRLTLTKPFFASRRETPSTNARLVVLVDFRTPDIYSRVLREDDQHCFTSHSSPQTGK